MITFEEYVGQLDPKRQFRVKVTPKDCYSISKPIDKRYKYSITLFILGQYYDYVTKIDSSVLYPIDGDGNAKSMSCFRLVED